MWIYRQSKPKLFFLLTPNYIQFFWQTPRSYGNWIAVWIHSSRISRFLFLKCWKPFTRIILIHATVLLILLLRRKREQKIRKLLKWSIIMAATNTNYFTSWQSSRVKCVTKVNKVYINSLKLIIICFKRHPSWIEYHKLKWTHYFGTIK